jgi:hypothetical protein
VNARAYVMLFVIALAGAAVLLAVGRRPHERGPARASAPAAPLEDVRVTLHARGTTPDRLTVRLGARVTAHARNADGGAHTLSLAGYDDRVGVVTIAPRDSATLVFLADRPGEDFAWLVDGQPAGVLVVAGSHLVEGHR